MYIHIYTITTSSESLPKIKDLSETINILSLQNIVNGSATATATREESHNTSKAKFVKQQAILSEGISPSAHVLNSNGSNNTSKDTNDKMEKLSINYIITNEENKDLFFTMNCVLQSLIQLGKISEFSSEIYEYDDTINIIDRLKLIGYISNKVKCSTICVNSINFSVYSFYPIFSSPEILMSLFDYAFDNIDIILSFSSSDNSKFNIISGIENNEKNDVFQLYIYNILEYKFYCCKIPNLQGQPLHINISQNALKKWYLTALVLNYLDSLCDEIVSSSVLTSTHLPEQHFEHPLEQSLEQSLEQPKISNVDMTNNHKNNYPVFDYEDAVSAFSIIYMEPSNEETLLSTIYEEFCKTYRWVNPLIELPSLVVFTRSLRKLGAFTITRRSKGIVVLAHTCLTTKLESLKQSRRIYLRQYYEPFDLIKIPFNLVKKEYIHSKYKTYFPDEKSKVHFYSFSLLYEILLKNHNFTKNSIEYIIQQFIHHPWILNQLNEYVKFVDNTKDIENNIEYLNKYLEFKFLYPFNYSNIQNYNNNTNYNDVFKKNNKLDFIGPTTEASIIQANYTNKISNLVIPFFDDRKNHIINKNNSDINPFDPHENNFENVNYDSNSSTV